MAPHRGRAISSRSSSDSLTISEQIASTDFEEFALIEETFDMDISSMGSDEFFSDIPPFPSARATPIATIIDLGVGLVVSPGGFSLSGASETEDLSPPVVTIPTTQRLKTMLNEPLCARAWAEKLLFFDAPGHVPWGGLKEAPERPWVPEGSAFTPMAFKSALSAVHRAKDSRYTTSVQDQLSPPATKTPRLVPKLSPPSRASCPLSSPASRDALVFEHEFTREDEGKPKFFSLQVDARNMDPEMVKMMLELHDLSSFFQREPKDVGSPGTSLRPPALTLTVSNSEITLPISIESTPKATEVLAVRRGKKALAALAPTNKDVYPYPSIPTPFLGSPSTYSPKFEFANQSDEPSMDLDDMIASLRSRCASIGECGSPSVEIFEEDSLINQPSPFSKSPAVRHAADPEEDEWAFADHIMHVYEHSTPQSTHASQTPSKYPSRCSSLPASQLKNSITFESDSSAFALELESLELGAGPAHALTDSGISCRRYTTPVGLAPSTPLPTLPRRPVQKEGVCMTPHPGRPPSTPLPLHSAAPGLSASKQVRGILKSAKSVRFASLPTDDELPSATPITPGPRPFSKPRAKGALKPPSPLRQSFSPSTDNGHLPVTSAVTPRGTPARPTVSRTQVRRSLASEMLLNVPVVTMKPRDRRATVSYPPRMSSTKSNGAEPTPRKVVRKAVSSVQVGGYSTRESGKENKLTPMHGSRVSTLDENVLRRGKNALGSQKSKMPTPLRNIFTRFK